MGIPLDYSRDLLRNEEQAYKNLSKYDEKAFIVDNIDQILAFSTKRTNFLNASPAEILDTSVAEVEHNSLYGSKINEKFLAKRPGFFADESSYLATFGKKAYYSSEVEYYINLFISHNHIHAFYDGNKRTALNLFIDMVTFHTSFKFVDILLIQNAQILYIEKRMTKNEFENIIYSTLK